ncbi:MAG: tetratricopeptide repeat protein [Candidatus Eisenbacteria bacterium]|nr:tetratricopeptide repeat protein [Candidatus Eisenbacteria bacterium]
MWRTIQRVRVSWLTVRGDAERKAGRYEDAERLLNDAVAVREQIGGQDDQLDATLWNAVGVLCKYQARFPEGSRAYLRGLRAARRCFGRRSAAVATYYHNLGGLEHARGRYRRAEPLAREAVTLREAALGSDHPDVARDLAAWGGVLDGLNRHAEAEAAHRRALAIFERTLGPRDLEVAFTQGNLAACLHLQGREPEAVRMAEDATLLLEQRLGATHPELGRALSNLAILRAKCGDRPAAAEAASRAMAILSAALDPDHPGPRETRQTLQRQGLLD